MEKGNLLAAELKTLDIRMLRELNEHLNSIKKMLSEMKNTLIEIKNNLQGNNCRLHEAKNQINNWEHKEAKNNQSEQEEKKRIQKIEDSKSRLCDNFKRSSIHITSVQEGEEKQ